MARFLPVTFSLPKYPISLTNASLPPDGRGLHRSFIENETMFARERFSLHRFCLLYPPSKVGIARPPCVMNMNGFESLSSQKPDSQVWILVD